MRNFPCLLLVFQVALPGSLSALAEGQVSPRASQKIVLPSPRPRGKLTCQLLRRSKPWPMLHARLMKSPRRSDSTPSLLVSDPIGQKDGGTWEPSTMRKINIPTEPEPFSAL